MHKSPTFRRIALTLPSSSLRWTGIELSPPAVEDRLSAAEADHALRHGMTPLVFHGDRGEAIFLKSNRLDRARAAFRDTLRHFISGGQWTPDSSVENQLLWGYLLRTAEYDSRDELRALATRYRKAAAATDQLRRALQSDGRLYDGIPLPVALDENRAACDEQAASIDNARTDLIHIAGKALDDLIWRQFLDWLDDRGAWEVVSQTADEERFVYRLDRLSIADLERMASDLQDAAELAEWIVNTGTNQTMKRPAAGGHPIDYPMKWLIGETHRLQHDDAWLSELILAHRNAIPSFRGLARDTIKKRIKEAWRRMAQAQSLPTDRYPSHITSDPI